MPLNEGRFYSHSTHPEIPPELGRMVSVTTVTSCYPKPWLAAYYKKLGIEGAEKHTQEACDVGSRVHELIHAWLSNTHIDVDPEVIAVQNAFQAFLDWASRVSFEMVDTEQVIYSATHGYAGRLDAVGWVDGKFSLIDFKSSKGVYAEHEIQLAAYATAYEEWRPRLYGSDNRPLERLIVIRLGKTDGAFEPHDLTSKRAKAFSAFLALKEIWAYSHPQVTQTMEVAA